MFEDCDGVGAARGGCAICSGPRLSKIWSSQRRCILKVSRPVDVVAPRSLARSRRGHAVRVCESVLSRCNYTGALHDKGADVEDVMVVGVLCDGRPLAAELRVRAAWRILIGTTPISSTIEKHGVGRGLLCHPRTDPNWILFIVLTTFKRFDNNTNSVASAVRRLFIH